MNTYMLTRNTSFTGTSTAMEEGPLGSERNHHQARGAIVCDVCGMPFWRNTAGPLSSSRPTHALGQQACSKALRSTLLAA